MFEVLLIVVYYFKAERANMRDKNNNIYCLDDPVLSKKYIKMIANYEGRGKLRYPTETSYAALIVLQVQEMNKTKQQ